MSTKKLISYNSKKHPEVARFFEELEDTNLTSHYVREAIKFYVQYKNQVTTTLNVPSIQSEPLVNSVAKESNKLESSGEVNEEDEFEEFDPDSLF